MMMNCYRATRLMSESRERALNFRERLALKVHKAMCAGCRNFDKHLGFLRQAGDQYVSRDDSLSNQPDRSANEQE